MDTVLVGFFLNSTAVGFYVLADQIVQFIETPADALGFTLSPTYGSEKAEGNIKQAANIYETALTQTLAVYIPAAMGVFLVAEPAIIFIFGLEYEGAIIVLQILSIFIILKSVTKITSDGLDYLGRAKSRAYVMTASSILNLILNIILIPHFGVEGAALATVISYSIYTLFNLYLVKIELGVKMERIYSDIIKILFVSIIMAIFVLYLLKYVSGVISLSVVVAFGGLVWLLLSSKFNLIDFAKAY
ncbi:polysaccharide biosynthesis protein [Natronorubrum bangense JCM 10635]|uniref:Polysaccharide biosynthesis protein n=2 Tax=Natronorubrum bangense TaxID=61858 RepID=L9VZP4_9EURY|nr:polysaccharide biosynthesis protein [Natronorubrum bangense JCM 10635]